MKKTCDSPITALGLIRIGLGIFFLAFGIGKLMNPPMIVEMMHNLFGFEGAVAVMVAWLVIATETIGGIFVLAGRIVPDFLYRGALAGFLVITVVGFTSAHWIANKGGFDLMQFWWHLLLVFVIIGLSAARPKCPLGMTGDKE